MARHRSGKPDATQPELDWNTTTPPHIVDDAVSARPIAPQVPARAGPAAQSADALFDIDDPRFVANPAETRLLAKVAARVPADAVLWSADDGYPAVLLSVVARGTYGQANGIDRGRQPITARGYVLDTRPVRGGIGGWASGPVMVVKLGAWPEGPVVSTVQTDMRARLTVLGRPGDDLPPGEGPPWLRMSVEEQILAARSALGLSVAVIAGPHNELWRVEGCPAQLTSEVASWLFGGDHGSWEARARPRFSQQRIDEAVRAGQLPSHDELWPTPHTGPATPTAGLDDDRNVTASKPSVRALRRHVTALLAESLIYDSLAVAAEHSDADGFHTPNGHSIDADRIDTHLVRSAERARQENRAVAAGSYRGISVTFHPLDEHTTQMWMSVDGVNHIRLPVAHTWFTGNESGRVLAAMVDAVANASTLATDLSARAHALAEQLTLPHVRFDATAGSAFRPLSGVVAGTRSQLSSFVADNTYPRGPAGPGRHR